MDLEWLYKLRIKYWEIRRPSERYSLLRKAKNRADGHAGEYTIDAVSERTKVMASTIRKLEGGAYDVADAVFEVLLSDLGLTREQFQTEVKLKDPSGAEETDSTFDLQTIAVNTPTPRKRRTKAEMLAASSENNPAPVDNVLKHAPTPAPPAPPTKGVSLSVVNHTEVSFIIRQEGAVLHILDDKRENVSKGIWVAPADIVGDGTKIVPRSTSLK